MPTSRSSAGASDIFLSVLKSMGDNFVYSTYLGGSGMETDPAVDRMWLLQPQAMRT